MKTWKNFWKGLLVFLLLLLAWDLLCRAGIWSSYVLPSPGSVWRAFLNMSQSGELLQNIAVSLKRVLTGFVISFVLSFLFGLLSALFPKALPFYRPLLNALRHVPPLSLVPLLILWFGIGETPKIAVIVLASFFPMLINTDSGLAGCDKKLLEVGKTLGFSKSQQFFKIMLPYAVPDILVGMRIWLGYSLRAIVGAEMIAAASGLGYMILDAQTMSRTDKVIVGIVVIGAIGLVIDQLFKLVIRLVSHGRREVQECQN
ncbi:MAG: ABC transporter permease [Oscillospiraceae bacterium]|nr:ABC transporter permease [Oscillospiraceae bacterium]